MTVFEPPPGVHRVIVQQLAQRLHARFTAGRGRDGAPPWLSLPHDERDRWCGLAADAVNAALAYLAEASERTAAAHRKRMADLVTANAQLSSECRDLRQQLADLMASLAP
jgi:hypothetical protein